MAVSRRTRGWLLAGWAAAVVGVLTLNLVSPLPGREQEWPWVLGLMAFPVAAALVLTSRPRNRIGWLLATVGTSAGLIFVLSWYAQSYPAGPLSRQLEAAESVPAVLQFGGILGLLHLFPTGRPCNRAHAWVVSALWWYIATFALLGVVRPGPLQLTGRSNPFGVGPLWLGDVHATGIVGVALFVGLGFVVVVARWRRAEAVERAQLKWFYAAATWVLVIATLLAVTNDDDPGGRVFELVAGIVVATAFWSLPLAIVIAITRYHLYDIDRVISRTVTYTIVVAVLGAVYVGAVAVLTQVSPATSDVAVAGSTLTVAALFRPLHRRVRNAVDRRFDRAHYEHALVTTDFAARVRQEVDIDMVARDLGAVVRRTMQPAAVGLWLRPVGLRGEAELRELGAARVP